MKVVITYGTFDLFHYGHYLLLKRAKALGDYLIVGVSTDEMCASKGKVCIFPEKIRMQMVEDLKFVDKVIPEKTMKQKVEDIINFDVDIFTLGSDYANKFQFMDEYELVSQNCKIIYLERTPDISSSDLKDKLLRQVETEKLF